MNKIRRIAVTGMDTALFVVFTLCLRVKTTRAAF